jgi:hypothetical protein
MKTLERQSRTIGQTAAGFRAKGIGESLSVCAFLHWITDQRRQAVPAGNRARLPVRRGGVRTAALVATLPRHPPSAPGPACDSRRHVRARRAPKLCFPFVPITPFLSI